MPAGSPASRSRRRSRASGSSAPRSSCARRSPACDAAGGARSPGSALPAAAAAVAAPAPARAASVAGGDARRRPPALPTGGRTRPLSVRLRELRDDPVGYSRHVATRIVRLPYRAVRRLVGPFVLFPLRPMAWAAALEDVAEPADLWHGMWAGSLPALERLRRRHGGRTVYDSRDVYLHARVFDRMRPAMRSRFVRLEQRWARAADLVVTVNDAYADILVPLLGIPRPLVVRNCPDPVRPARDASRPDPRARGDPARHRGRPLPGRPDDRAGRRAGDGGDPRGAGGPLCRHGVREPARGVRRARRAAPVPRPRLGHRPGPARGAAGVDRVCRRHAHGDPADHAEPPLHDAAEAVGGHRRGRSRSWRRDLPGMAEVVREVGCGTLCDPTSPASIAAAIRELLGARPPTRARRCGHACSPPPTTGTTGAPRPRCSSRRTPGSSGSARGDDRDDRAPAPSSTSWGRARTS